MRLEDLKLKDRVPAVKKQLQVSDASNYDTLIGTFSTEGSYDGFYVLLNNKQLRELRDWINTKLDS